MIERDLPDVGHEDDLIMRLSALGGIVGCAHVLFIRNSSVLDISGTEAFAEG
ncbi:hypothetical protein ACLOJK_005041 [Asimina triloba]